MTFSLSVSGSRKEAPYHPFTIEQAVAFDEAVARLQADLAAAGLQGSIGGSRPSDEAGKPSVSISKTF